ncbi:MAG: glycosyltransferase family 2 protein [Dysgonamonadaceae bacterium]|nr:glycosyltransferase family 2 protein [Dysgonamonadaceae bacterium]
MKISVVIQTLNSGNVLRACLESVKNFDEIVVCDMYSRDDTLEIAKAYGCKIVMHELCNGIVEPARNFAVRSASHEWVFVVDSDEVVTESLKDYLYAFIKSENPSAGLLVPRKNYFMNKFIRASFPDYQLRFFRKERFVLWPETIHSRPEIAGEVKRIPPRKELAFIHLDENRISNLILKLNKYSDRELGKRNFNKANGFYLISKPLFHFFQLYLFKKGFLDGKEGFIYACLIGFYKYLIIAKMIERKKQLLSGKK